jgi:hypothetical protein
MTPLVTGAAVSVLHPDLNWGLAALALVLTITVGAVLARPTSINPQTRARPEQPAKPCPAQGWAAGTRSRGAPGSRAMSLVTRHRLSGVSADNGGAGTNLKTMLIFVRYRRTTECTNHLWGKLCGNW